MSLKIYEPVTKTLKHFNTPEEFERYLAKHKNEFDDWTTHKLNRTFKIDGYRITKVNDEICLKKDYYKYITQKEQNKEESELLNKDFKNEINEKIEDLEFNINQLTNRIKALEHLSEELKKAFNDLISQLT